MDWNAKVGSQDIPGVTGKFGLRVQNEAGQRLREFCQENTLIIANTLFQQHQRQLYTWTSTRWSVLKSDWYSVQLKMEKSPHSLQKQDLELTAAQIMNSLLQNQT